MEAERWQKIDRLFHDALERDADQRSAFVTKACGFDEGLRREVHSLLRSHEEADGFIETPAADVAADLLADVAPNLSAGQSVGPYRIDSLLGEGGMGQVYLADDNRLNRKVALKLLPPHFTVHRDRVRRFEREARAASALNHPNIVTIYEIGQSDSAHFIATEFVDGKTLRQLINEKPFTLRESLNVAVQIAGALMGAHAAGIVHRDIKPENIMIRGDGYVKVLDFGLAKLTEPNADIESETPTLLQSNPGLVMGTVQYMSPEQARAKKVNARADIWSLGIVLYELLAGHVPFSGETPSHVMVSLMEDELPPLSQYADVPVELDRIVTKALRKNQSERYKTAGEMARDLKTLKEELQLEARSKGFLETVPAGKVRTTGAQASSLTTTFATGSAALQSGEMKARPPTSAEYLVSEIKLHQRGFSIAAATLAIAIIIIGYFYVAAKKPVAASSEAIDSVAVLPFVNASGDPQAEYLSEGISDSLINSLSRLPNLRVNSLNSVLRYKGQQIDPQRVGREQTVRAVLMGRMTQHGAELAITAELVDVRDNHRLWGGQYNRKLSDILIVQDEIAREITEGLRLRLTGEQKKQLAKQYTQNNEAYLLYSLGNYYFRQNTKEALEKSSESFEQAIKIDPKYALAYAGLARTYQWMGTRGFWSVKESGEKLEWAVLKALQLDDTLAEGHVLLGVYKGNNFDWKGAAKELERALELNPNSYLANFSYSHYLMNIGKPVEALPYAIRAQELDAAAGPGELAFAYGVARQYDKAIELYRKGIERRPDNPHPHILLGEIYLAKAMPAEALAEMRKGIALDTTLAKTPERWDRYPMLAYACAAAGQRAEALKILGEQQRLAKQRYVSPFNFVIIYTGLGDKDQAFAWLAKGVEERATLIWHVKMRPMFDSLRSDPRYEVLIRRMNLEP